MAAATSAAPAALPTNLPSSPGVRAPLAPPTATPTFPETRITEQTLPALRLLRTVGFGTVRQARITPDNRLLAVATTAGVGLFELPSLRHLRFDPIDDGAYAITLSDDGQTLVVATGTRDDPKQIERRRLADGKLLETAPAAVQQGLPELISLSPSGQVQATLNPLDSVPNPGVTLTRVADNTTIYTDTVTEWVAFSPDSTLAALVAYTSTVRLLDLQSGAISELHLPSIWSIVFSPDAQTLVAAGRVVTLWNVVDGALRETPDGLAVAGTSILGGEQWVRYSADGRVLTVEGEYYVFEAGLRRASAWTAGESGLAHAWDIDAQGQFIGNYATYVGAISPAADAAAWTDDGQALGLYRNGKLQHTLQIPHGVSSLAFSPDGALLAVGDLQGQIQLVRVADGTTMQITQAADAAAWLAFSPDGALLGAKSADGTIRIWDIGERRFLAPIADTPARDATLLARTAHVPFLITTDHEWLIAWGQDGVRFYRLSDGQLAHHIAVAADDVAIGPRRRLLAILHGVQVQLWGVP
jgi:WD40 repeat protein